MGKRLKISGLRTSDFRFEPVVQKKGEPTMSRKQKLPKRSSNRFSLKTKAQFLDWSDQKSWSKEQESKDSTVKEDHPEPSDSTALDNETKASSYVLPEDSLFLTLKGLLVNRIL